MAFPTRLGSAAKAMTKCETDVERLQMAKCRQKRSPWSSAPGLRATAAFAYIGQAAALQRALHKRRDKACP